MTGAVMPTTNVTPNHVLRSMIKDFVEKQKK